ncbi:hypothetical protein C8J57DRAFT_1286652 [Mycena rebaudengoi]|nr:hypothetical protein C8J57DRAFT_1286652 [Mycena rebaudengoi]
MTTTCTCGVPVGGIIIQRDRAEERHLKIKTKLKAQEARFTELESSFKEALAKEREEYAAQRKREREEDAEERRREREEDVEERRRDRAKHELWNIEQLKATIITLEHVVETMVLAEEYEVVDGVLRGHLSQEEKETLKQNGLTYIFHLLRYQPNPPCDDPNTLDLAFHTVLEALTEDEWDLCYKLYARRQNLRDLRNNAQHPRPDRSTAERWLKQIAPDYETTFQTLLDSGPFRIQTSNDDERTDRRIIVEDGEYLGPEAKQELLAQLKDRLGLELNQAVRLGGVVV